MKFFLRFTTAILVLVVLAGCTLFGKRTLTPASGEVLFYDDFTKVSSGWDRLQGENGLTDYWTGSYLIRVEKANLDLWANPGIDLEDTSIEVDAQKADGPENNSYGVICRYADEKNFYFGVVSSDGYYAIGKMQDGAETLLTGSELNLTDKVKGGTAINHLRFDCFGSALTLYVNGLLLGSVEDGSLAAGDVGLIAGTFSEPGTAIEFDHFAVFQP